MRRYVKLPHGQGAYVDEGPPDGSVAVLVHGMPGNARDFRHLASPLSARMRVVRLDLPGFGESAPAGVTVDAMAEAVLSFIDALALVRPWLVGHSLGGAFVTAAADLAPARIAGLALICSPGLRLHNALRRTPRRTIRLGLRSPIRPLLAPALVSLMYRAGFSRRLDEAEILRGLAVASRYDAAMHRARLQRVTHPTLHAWCEDDPFVDGPISRELEDHLARRLEPRRHRTLRYATGGHNPQKHHAEALATALADFADRARRRAIA